MDMYRRLRGAISTSGSSKEEGGQARSLLTEDGGVVSDSEDGLGTSFPHRQRRRWSEMGWALSFGILGLYSVLLTLVVLKLSTRPPTDLECAKQLSIWSPLNDAIEYQDVYIENGFTHDTIYRGPPTQETENAWRELSHTINVVPFPEDKLAAVNKSAVLPDGRLLQTITGDPTDHNYVSLFGVWHDLHCLNMIRQYTWREWYSSHQDTVQMPSLLLDSEEESRTHTDHCLEALRISITCQGDTTPYFSILDPDWPTGEQIDMSPQRKCRDFGKLQSWTKENYGEY